MAITDKLNKLLETKEAIKTAIKAKNVSVLDSEPFSVYPSKINEISTGGGTSSLDWSEIGYDEQPQSLTDGFNYAKQIYNSWKNNTTIFYNGDNNLMFFPLVDTSNVTSLNNSFYGCSSLISMPLINTSNVISFDKAFYNCSSLKSIPLIDMTSATTLKESFYGCSSLKSIPLFNTSKIENFEKAFSNCEQLETIPAFDMSNANNTNGMLYRCNRLKTVPSLNTINVTNMGDMFAWNNILESVGRLNADSVTNIKNVFYFCPKLTNIGGFTNLAIDLDLSSNSLLTVDSLMNVINEAKDLSETGTATLTLGSTNIEKLTEEQIAIASSKGWTLA